MIRYVIGDATAPIVDGPRVIAHICNDVGAWGAGFVLAISRRWPKPEQKYREWYAHPNPGPQKLALGRVQFVNVTEDIAVANMIAQRGFRSKDGPPIRYDALENCLGIVGDEARIRKASIHMPRIGCGIAGGTWSRVEPLLEQNLGGIEVVVYDLESERRRESR